MHFYKFGSIIERLDTRCISIFEVAEHDETQRQ